MAYKIILKRGQKINRWTVLYELDPVIVNGKKRRYILCECKCGNTRKVNIDGLSSGKTNSCGCYHKEVVTKGRFAKKHGLSNHPLFSTWRKMIDRCYNPLHEGFNNYGKRGINVCSAWRENPQIFIDWAVNNNWEKGLQIDRINNNKGYSPKNCRVVTRFVNAQNTRATIRVKTKDGTISLKHACRINNLLDKYDVIRRRYKIYKSFEKAIEIYQP